MLARQGMELNTSVGLLLPSHTSNCFYYHFSVYQYLWKQFVVLIGSALYSAAAAENILCSQAHVHGTPHQVTKMYAVTLVFNYTVLPHLHLHSWEGLRPKVMRKGNSNLAGEIIGRWSKLLQHKLLQLGYDGALSSKMSGGVSGEIISSLQREITHVWVVW